MKELSWIKKQILIFLGFMSSMMFFWGTFIQEQRHEGAPSVWTCAVVISSLVVATVFLILFARTNFPMKKD